MKTKLTKKKVKSKDYNALVKKYNKLKRDYDAITTEQNELEENAKKVTSAFIEKANMSVGNYIETFDKEVSMDELEEWIGNILSETYEETIKQSLKDTMSSEIKDTICQKFKTVIEEWSGSETINKGINELVTTSLRDFNYVIKYTIKDAIEKKVTEQIKETFDEKIHNLLNNKVQSEETLISEKEVQEMMKTAVYNSFKYTRFDLTDDPYYKKIVVDILHSLEISKEDCEEISELIKNGVKEAVQFMFLPPENNESKYYGTYSTYTKKVIQSAVQNELYRALRDKNKDKDFLSSIKLEACSLSNEFALEIDFKKFCTEMKSRSDVVRFDYFVLKSVEKNYKVCELFEDTEGNTFSRTGVLGNTYKEEKLKEDYYKVFDRKKYKSSYVLIGEVPYIERDFIQYLKNRKLLEEEVKESFPQEKCNEPNISE